MDGITLPAQVYARKQGDFNSRVYIGVVRSITDFQEIAEKVEYLVGMPADVLVVNMPPEVR